MITIKIQFDYEDVHYAFHASLKWDCKQHACVLTDHKHNDPIDLTYFGYGEISLYVRQDNLPCDLEVEVYATFNGIELRGVNLWRHDIILAAKGEFENYQESVKGNF